MRVLGTDEEGESEPIAEIGAGELIGELALSACHGRCYDEAHAASAAWAAERAARGSVGQGLVGGT
jgi:hypothetical protein